MIKICELSPRDGIQVFKKFIPTETKIKLINAISDSGIKEIHVTYFAHPKVITQLRDAEEVCSKIRRRREVKYIGFIPNEVGLRRALHSKIDRISFFMSIEDSINLTFFRKNLGSLLEEMIVVAREAKSEGLEVEAFIVRAFESGNRESACRVAEQLVKAGVDILYFSNFGEPVRPKEIYSFFKSLSPHSTNVEIGIHLYAKKDEMASLLNSALDSGLKRFVTSLGGIGVRKIDGRLVTLPPTELLVNIAGLDNLRLEPALKIIDEINNTVEKVGSLW